MQIPPYPVREEVHTPMFRPTGGFDHSMFITVNNDEEEINIKEEVRLEEEAEEEPNLNKDGWGRIRP